MQSALQKTSFLLILLIGSFLYVNFILKIGDLSSKWQLVIFCLICVPVILLRLSNLKKILLIGLILSIPFTYLDISFFHNPKIPADFRINISITDLFVGCFLILGLYKIFVYKNYSVYFPKFLAIGVAGLLTVSALSIMNAPIKLLGFFEWLRLLKMVFLLVVILNVINTIDDLSLILKILLLALIIQSFLGIAQHFAGGYLGLGILGENMDIRSFATHTRIGGTLGHPNRLAMFLEMHLPVALAVLLFYRDYKMKLLGALAFLSGTTTLIFTLSRGGWGGLIFSTCVVLYYFYRKTQNKKLLLRVLFLIVAGLSILAALFSGPLMDRLFTSDGGSALSRIELAKLAMNVIKKYPLIGGGIGNYVFYLPVTVFPFKLFEETAKVHNLYLLLTAEMGLLATLFYLYLLFTTLAKTYKRLKSCCANFIVNIFLIGGLAGLSSFAIHCLVDYVDINRWPILWVYIGLLLVANKLSFKWVR
ncbi:MAG: hypothetical protein D6813_15815 [Calditrichaeota bacterium]|nr:MAG: hypothetical protein D6813_15815 [Calditrichota bacterium]